MDEQRGKVKTRYEDGKTLSTLYMDENATTQDLRLAS